MSAYLFDPDDVKRYLTDLPHLRSALSKTDREITPSISFPAARKSDHQIYRVLSNTHYPHLAALARSLDYCIGRGFSQPTILRTSGRSDFQSALSELHIAEHLLLRGFEIEGLDTQKGSDSVPDLIARRGDLSIAVEVYAPREWEGLTWLTDSFVDALKNLDLPFDYRFNVRLELLENFDARHRLLICHPGELARALDSDKRDAMIMALVEEVEKRLCAGEAAFRVEHSARAVNLRISVKVKQAGGNTKPLPMRKGCVSLPTLSGHAPEGMFDSLTHRRVRKKASKGQAPRSGLSPNSLLCVDLACAELSCELVHDSYRAKFEQIARKRLGPGLFGYDAVALCQWHSWGEPTKLHFLVGRNDRAALLRSEVFES